MSKDTKATWREKYFMEPMGGKMLGRIGMRLAIRQRVRRFLQKKLINTPSETKLMDWGVFPHQDEDKDDYKIASWAVEKLAKMPADQPFILSAGFFLPHVPCFVTQKWMDLYPEETLILKRKMEI